MAELSQFRLWWLLYFVQPVHLRTLYQTLHETPPRSLLEVGSLDLRRTELLVRVVRHAVPQCRFRYVGISRFEEAGGPPVKQVYRSLRELDTEVVLLPGRLSEVLPRWANHVADIDVVLLWRPEVLRPNDRLWFYIPRMLSESGRVLMEWSDSQRSRWAVVSKEEAMRRADAAVRRRAA
ncbi:hypothetical protein [Thermogutta sp.]|uniref:hypothetical protein n=1 Tax=Thermogutta sp. TaxID=1962930 RepID=UPI0032206601